jgi:hypothetical protein
VTNFINKIDKKKMYLEGQFHQLKNPRWLYCKIETPGVSLQMTQTQDVIMQFFWYETVFV